MYHVIKTWPRGAQFQISFHLERFEVGQYKLRFQKLQIQGSLYGNQISGQMDPFTQVIERILVSFRLAFQIMKTHFANLK